MDREKPNLHAEVQHEFTYLTYGAANWQGQIACPSDVFTGSVIALSYYITGPADEKSLDWCSVVLVN